MAPAPIIAIFFGISSKTIASFDVIICLWSIFRLGRFFCLVPVAIIIILEVMTLFFPSEDVIDMFCESFSIAVPGK